MASLILDLKNEAVGGYSLAPKLVSTNTNATGDAVDLSNAQGQINATLIVGTTAGTTPTMDLKLQSNTTSATTGFTDITGATFTQVTSSAQRQVIKADMPQGHNWVRVTGTFSTQVTGFMVAVDIVAQKKLAGTTSSGVSRSPST
jgi:hypothetical protein